MKWIAKRILLKSYDYMDIALTQLVIPFVDQIKKEDGITDWYCSRKTENDGTKPSVRIYLNIDEQKESHILSKLDILLKKKENVIGWTGKYNDPDPDLPNYAKPNLKQIQIGCEIGRTDLPIA